MSVRREKRRDPATGAMREFWMVDVDYQLPDGKRAKRVRKVSPVQTKRGAEQYERELRESIADGTHGKEVAAEEPRAVPTVREFADDFLETYAVTNNKPSEVANKRSILKIHVKPHLGKLRLDEVGRELEPFKAKLLKGDGKRKPSHKRINNILAVVGKMLRYAEEREIIASAPTVRLLKLPPSKFMYFDFEEYGRLLTATKIDPEWHAAIVVGADAGLRMGEIIALEWSDVDFSAGNLTIRRADWHGIVGQPKGGRPRTIPMTDRLIAALKAHRHLRGPRVFCAADGSSLTRNKMKKPLWRICLTAKLPQVGWHALRHTFCSHLAMRGAAPAAIKELAGHTSMSTTQRYMHLAPGMLRDTVRLLDQTAQVYGNLTATETKSPAAGSKSATGPLT